MSDVNAETTDGADPAETNGDDEPERRSLGILPSVPNTVVTFGAGCLATATLLTLLAFLYVTWMFITGNSRGLADYQVILAIIQMGFATALLGAGTYSALKRIRWTLVMLAAIMGSFAVITIPFTALAVVSIGLGKIHFSANIIE